MKVLKVILLTTIILVFVSVIALFVILKTVDVNQYKNQIVEQAGKALGRAVGIDRVSLVFSFFRGVTLNVDRFSLADHPDFSPDPLFQAEAVHLNVDVAALVLKREIRVSKIEIVAPVVQLIRNKAGTLNVQTLVPAETMPKPPEPSAGAPVEQTAKQPAVGVSPAVEKKPLPRLSVKDIRVVRGAVVFRDRLIHKTETVIPVREIQIRVADFSLDKPFSFSATAALWAERPNIEVAGKALMNIVNSQVRCDDVTWTVDVNGMSTAKMIQDIPLLAESGLKDTDRFQGEVEGKIDQMVAGQEGLLMLRLNGQLKEGGLWCNLLPFPIEPIELKVEMTEADAVLPKISLGLASGYVTAQGRIDDYLKEQKFSYALKIENVDVGKLVDEKNLAVLERVRGVLGAGEESLKKPAKIVGRLNGTFEGSGQGVVPEALKKSLTGRGTLLMRDGRLEGINVLRAVVNALSMLPGLGEKMAQTLPEKYRETLSREETLFPRLDVETEIKDGVLQVSRAELEGEDFLLSAKAALDFDLNLNLESGFFISSEMSSAMTAASEELMYLLDDNKQIFIPFKPYKGKLTGVRTYPDPEYLGKKILKEKGADELKKLLHKALGREESSEAPASPDQPSAYPSSPQGDQEKRPEDVIIDSLFNSIFK